MSWSTSAASRRAPARRLGVAAAIGLACASALIAVAIAVPILGDVEVASRAARSADPRALPPLHGYWLPHLGIASAAVIALAFFAARDAPRLARTLPWRPLLATATLAALAWLLLLALVDGPAGLSRVLGNPYEYLRTARAVDDIGALLRAYIAHIPADAADPWVTHVAGHPPAMLLFFVLLDRIGLGGDLAAGIVVTVIAATLPAAVLVTLRALGQTPIARRAAPFLVFSPAAVFLAVSADAVIATVAAWGLCLLAQGAAATRRGAAVAWSAGAGILLGLVVMMSYGMPLLGLLALAVPLAARRILPIPVAAVCAAAVVGAFAIAGFALWDAFPVITERYWDGIASRRPAAYWSWANIAALLISAGPLVGAGLGAAAVSFSRGRRIPLLLVGAAVAAIALADASGMSKAEVERIWLPFVPWLSLSLVFLSPRWRRFALPAQLVWALAVQHLLYTVW